MKTILASLIFVAFASTNASALSLGTVCVGSDFGASIDTNGLMTVVGANGQVIVAEQPRPGMAPGWMTFAVSDRRIGCASRTFTLYIPEGMPLLTDVPGFLDDGFQAMGGQPSLKRYAMTCSQL